MKIQVPTSFRFTSIVVLLLGIAMLIYWGMFVLQGTPTEGIPILSELINAALALISGYGMIRLRSWSIPTALFTAGMWGYGVIGGIGLVLENGLDFTSPFGALTDAIIFPLVLIFAVYLSIVVWRNREIISSNE